MEISLRGGDSSSPEKAGPEAGGEVSSGGEGDVPAGRLYFLLFFLPGKIPLLPL